MKIALGTLGCKLNQAETERLTRELLYAGHIIVDTDASADVFILNTCTVTQTADAKSRRWLRQVHRSNPTAKLIAIGCYAQRVPDELSKIEGVHMTAGSREKDALLPLFGLPPGSYSGFLAGTGSLRTRSFIKVQDGCSRGCSYCIVPVVRGHEKSQPADSVVNEVKSRVAEGYREIVLTGTEVGAYRADIRLHGLLQRILAETGISRLRLSSLQPLEVTQDLLDVWKDERMCPHFHLCLQSGSGSVLRRMKRAYTTEEFFRAVHMIRKSISDVSVTTDIIVGFPGETDNEFDESVKFCCETGFARIHVFPYSIRPGTEAASMQPQVNSRIKKDRCKKMRDVAKRSADVFMRQFINRTMDVLWETSKPDGTWSGFTGNYIKVFAKSEIALENRLLPAKLLRLKGDGIWAVAGRKLT